MWGGQTCFSIVSALIVTLMVISEQQIEEAGF